MELLIQGFGIIGIISGVGAYQSNHHKRILTLRITNELCFAIQYVLLGSIAACIVNLVVCVRNVAFRSYIQKGKCTKGLIILFTLLFILITAMNWPGPSGFIIIATKALSTIAFGSHDPKQLRLLNLGSCFLWLAFNLVISSYAGAFCEILSAISILGAIIRFDLLPTFHFKQRFLHRGTVNATRKV